MEHEQFITEGKALETHTLETGDLIIEGFAAEFEGNDRQNENFAEGAFQRGIKAFLEGSAPLCFHHKTEKVLGKVLELREIAGRGLWMRARIDGSIKEHPELRTIYNQIKRGTLKNLSVGGYFRRENTAAGKKITDMDFTEVSITAVPIHPRPAFAVVHAEKSHLDQINEQRDALEWLARTVAQRELDLIRLQFDVASILSR